MSSDFYVYVYLDPRKEGMFEYSNCNFSMKPFYIGKGLGNRLYRHLKEAKKGNEYHNPYKYNTIVNILSEGLEPIIVKVLENVSEEIAYEYEEALVNEIGLDNLTNLCKGGIGGSCQSEDVRYRQGSGMRGKKHSEEWKDKYARGKNNAFYGKHHSEETKQKLSQLRKGKKIGSFSEEHKQKISDSLKGKKHSAERVEKMKKSLTGRKLSEEHKQKLKGKTGENANNSTKWKVISPNGEENVVFGLIPFCKQMGMDFSIVYLYEKKGLNMPIKRGRSKGWSFYRIT